MIPVMCVVQEGQISTEVEYALKSAINTFSQNVFDLPADIDWIEVAKGSGFTAAKPSTSMIASLYTYKVLEQSERISLLRELCNICMEKTGLSPNEVMTSIRTPKK